MPTALVLHGPELVYGVFMVPDALLTERIIQAASELAWSYNQDIDMVTVRPIATEQELYATIRALNPEEPLQITLDGGPAINKETRPMRAFTLSEDRLRRVALRAETTEERAAAICLDYDWPNAAEHQHWLDTASAEELASWLRECIQGEDQARADIAAGRCDAGAP